MKCADCGSTIMRLYTADVYTIDAKDIKKDYDVFPISQMEWHFCMDVEYYVCDTCDSENIIDEEE